MEFKDKISIEPGVNLIDVLGNTGYSFESAISDLIDNSISAGAKTIEIVINYKNEIPYLYILDDGFGMTFEKLKEAAIIGFKPISESRNKFDLGRYSTGLKSATKSFCNNVAIASKVNGKINTVDIDYEYLKNENKWEAFVINDFKFKDEISQNGTMVYCDRLTIDFTNEELNYSRFNSLRLALSHTFGKYILNNKIKLYLKINNSKRIEIEGWNPFSLKENDTVRSVFKKELNYKKGKISIKTYIFPPFNNLSKINQEYVYGRGLLEQEGFYVYRNDRLIQEGGWLNLGKLGLDDKSKYCRIEMNITNNLDEEFKVNFSKTKIEIPNELENILFKIAKQGRQESYNTFNFKKGPKVSKVIKGKEERIWLSRNTNSGTELYINENHPLIKEYTSDMSKSSKTKLLTLLSKSIPVSMIQSQFVTNVCYTREELLKMMNDTYLIMKQEGMKKKEIIDKLKNMEPYKSDDDSLIIEFLGLLQED